MLGRLFGNRSAFELFLFTIGSDAVRIRLSRKWGVRIGNDCRIFSSKFGSEPYLITIGNHCEITAGVTFITHDGGTWIFREEKKFRGTRYGPITILDNSFIGMNSILLPGVRIGPNSIVGAGSVVTRDIPPDSVYAGNPARFICDTSTYLESCRLKNTGIIGSDEREEKLVENSLAARCSCSSSGGICNIFSREMLVISAEETKPMPRPMPPVFFYLPSRELINRVPSSVDDYWTWIHDSIARWPAKLGSRDITCTWLGPYNWVIQTFLYLRSDDIPCELVSSLPGEGIVITHGDFLPRFLKPLPRRFIVEIKPDRSLQCAHANFVIIQNRHDPICRGISRVFVKSAFVNYWPQPGLIPRDESRGDRFENICFMGNPEQFITDVDVLESEIKKVGLHWQMMPREKWHDYREVDAIVAVRPPGFPKTGGLMERLVLPWKGDNPIHSPERKPASKLLNAWAAGTPAIVSPDDAFEDLRISELDYLVAQDIQEIIEQLRQLRDNPTLRRAMAGHGRERAAEYSPEKVVREWKALIFGQIIPEYNTWTSSPFQRRLFFLARAVTHTARLI